MMNYRYPFYAILMALSFCCMSELVSNSGGAPSGSAGAPGDTFTTCANASCHGGSTNSGSGTAGLSTTIPPEGYTPGMTYTMTVNVAQSGRPRFGFQAVVLANANNANAGNVTITQNTRTRLNSGTKQYVTHARGGIDQNNSASWSFDWTAPATGEGAVTLYAAMMAANGNGNNGGDLVYTRTLEIPEAPAMSLDGLRHVADWAVYPNPAHEAFQVRLDLLTATGIAIQLRTLKGQEVYQETQELVSGNLQLTVPTEELVPGLYLLQVTAGNQSAFHKVLVQ
ncbi:MAG: choice-of-anchor V domain-containing protein [Bacteroidota bacterium]